MQSKDWLEHYYFERFLLEISIATLERGGVTSSLHTYEFLASIDAWGLPKYPDRTLILPPEASIAEGLRSFIQKNTSHLYAPGAWLGTWIHPLTHDCHLDVTEICPTLEEARRAAQMHSLSKQQGIVALYNFKHNLTVFLSGPGELCHRNPGKRLACDNRP